MSDPARRACSRALVLASSSAYRRALLERLCLPFEVASPEVDETPQPGEPPTTLVVRLARAKAGALADRYPDALILGSDQIAAIDEHLLGKPGNREAAARQLARVGGRTVRFHTAVALLDSASSRTEDRIVSCEVVFRRLTPAQIDAYLETEQPYDCAGSFKSERLGIALCERIKSDDPTALVGLPLIAVVGLLFDHGLDVLRPSPG